MPKKKTHEEFILEVKEINPNITIKGKYEKNNIPIETSCNICGFIWNPRPHNLLNKKGCPKCCGNILKTHQEFIDEIFIINPNIAIVGKYINRLIKVECMCKIDNFIWSATPGSLLSGKGCPKCKNKKLSENKSYSHEEFVDKLYNVNPNLLVLDKYSGSASKIKIRCLIDNCEWYAIARNLLFGYGCPECGKHIGDNNSNWNGGSTKLLSYLRYYLSEWKNYSMLASKYKCIITGERFDVIHHTYGFNLIIDETLHELGLPMYSEVSEYTDIELKNIIYTCNKLHCKYGLGVCMSKEEHDLFHKLYGFGNNTREQFEEFKAKRLQELHIA